jgi:hypothetical protein
MFADLKRGSFVGWRSQMIEHHEGMLLLTRNGKVGSAFTLARTIVESMYRGRWLNFCATDAQVEQFERKDELPLTMAEMADAIDEKYRGWRQYSERIDRRAAKILKAGVIETAYRVLRVYLT